MRELSNNIEEIMQKFLVLNLTDSTEFSSILEEVKLQMKLQVVQKCKDLHEDGLVFIDAIHLESVGHCKNHNFIGVVAASDNVSKFYDKHIFLTIPQDISASELKLLLQEKIALYSVRLLKQTFRKNLTYSFDDFIYYADNVFLHSSLGIAFLTKKLDFLLINQNFTTFFYNIYQGHPEIGKSINSLLDKEQLLRWSKINEQGVSFLGESFEISGKWDNLNKYYHLQITPILKLNHLIGYSVIIDDISQYALADADLKKYYKYLIEQNALLEKAYKEVELNNEKLKIAYEKVNALSNRDYLTQAPNRKYFLEKIEYEQLRFKRTKMPFILVYGDIDDFKVVNDDYGHETGDYVLIALTNLIKNTIRNIDFFCRWGGEEFLIFLAEPDLEIGSKIATRILQEIRNYAFSYNGIKLEITMTFGLAIYDKDQHINQIIDLADKKLYWGKNHNKDQVVTTIPEETESTLE